MHLLPYIAAYIGLAVFVLATVFRTIYWTRMPLHIRWELYPVAHEGARAHYGGSYLEESEWWTKDRGTSLLGELKVMVPEILFLVAVKHHNPRLWVRTFPFHGGLYLVVGSTVLMLFSGVLSALAPTALVGSAGTWLGYLIIITGAGGLILSLIGALGLLHRRLTELRDYSTKADIFNLVFFIAAFGAALCMFLLHDKSFALVSELVKNLVTFNLAPLTASTSALLLLTVTVLLMSILVGYIPLTHMSHFIGKYFAYHSIRWNDTPNMRGGAQEPVIEALLSQKVTWAAPHINGGGKKTWADVCTEKGES